MDIRILNKADNIASESWGRLATHVYESKEWFLANERYLDKSCFFYFTCWDNGTLRAIQPVYDGHDRYYAGPEQIFFRALKPFARGLKFLIAGSPLAFSSDIVGESSSLEIILPELEKFAMKNGYDAVAFPHQRSKIHWSGAKIRLSMTDYDLALPGNAFGDYLRLFEATRRRTAVRREMKTAGHIEFVQAPLKGNEGVVTSFVQA